MNRNWDSPEYKRMRRVVRKRDKCCQFPGCTTKYYKLQVHHIIPWSQSILLRYQPENCILICRNHHDYIKGYENVYSKFFFDILKNKGVI